MKKFAKKFLILTLQKYALKKKVSFSHKSDVYSYRMIVFEIVGEEGI
jgi:hypothetical protein